MDSRIFRAFPFGDGALNQWVRAAIKDESPSALNNMLVPTDFMVQAAEGKIRHIHMRSRVRHRIFSYVLYGT